MFNEMLEDSMFVQKALDRFDALMYGDETSELFLALHIHSVHDHVRGAALFLMKTTPDILTNNTALDSAADHLYQAIMSGENDILPVMAGSVLQVLGEEMTLINKDPCPEDLFWLFQQRRSLLMHRALTRRAEERV